MRLLVKTVGWAGISAMIFVIGATYKGCPLDAAVCGALVASLIKTPVYPLWELAFDKAWGAD